MESEHKESMLEKGVTKEVVDDNDQGANVTPESNENGSQILDNFRQLLKHLPEDSLAVQLVQKRISAGEKFSEADINEVLHGKFNEMKRNYEQIKN